MGTHQRTVLFAAFDADHDKYTFMSVAAGSLLTNLADRAHVRATYTSPPSAEVGPDYVAEHAESIVVNAQSQPLEELDVLFGVYVWNEPLIRALLPLLRLRGLTSRIILGGPQITAAPPNTLEGLYPQADVFVRGEAEDALVEVVRTTDRLDVPGVHYAGGEDKGTHAQADLAALPSPYLHHTGFIPFERVGRVRWETKRGCRYACAYCQHRRRSREVREYGRERLFDEMALFVEKGVETLTVLDAVFNTGDTYMDVMSELVRLGYAGRLAMQCRFEDVTDEFLELARQLDTCLEFGLQTIHPEECRAIGRDNNLVKIEGSMQKLDDMGIHYEVDLMYGLPAQTVDSFRRSVEFCRRHTAHAIRAWPLMLLRGTAIGKPRFREKWGLREDDSPVPVVTSSNSFTEREWQEMKALADGLRTLQR